MGFDVTIKIGGAAGQGIQTVGDLLAEIATNSGFHVMAVNDFESRIRGGHSFFQIRISDQPVSAPSHRVHLLVALDKSTFPLHHQQLDEKGIIISEEETIEDDRVIVVSTTKLAVEAGGRVMANTVAVGAILSLLGAPFESLKVILEERFARKSQKLVDDNLKAARLGIDAVSGKSFAWAIDWPASGNKRTVISGSKSVSLGALSADCRLAAFYPMSPATDIMTHLVPYAKKLPLVVEQVEDEIAAINMAIGASYAGVRAITATSGGGFCLMTEGVGLAGITETPVVVVNSQRPGPATGLATRTAQADLRLVIHAGQDEFPRFVFAPGSPDEAYQKTQLAFHLADKYQVPAIILTDQYFNDSLFSLEEKLKLPDAIERFILEGDQIADPGEYKRYAITETGISPRALPCDSEALVGVSGNEHTEDGHITEDQTVRVEMVDKRNRKIPLMVEELEGPSGLHEDAKTVLVGWGSTKGAIREAVEMLREKGKDVGCLHFADIWPFPVDKTVDKLKGVERFLMVEQNSSAQLGLLIREQTGLSFANTILKYDGRPFYPIEIAEQALKLMEA